MENTKFGLIFMGSGSFALEVLKKIVNSKNIELLAVISQPDKPFGRKKILKPTLVSEYCANYLVNVPLFKAANSSEIITLFNEYETLFKDKVDYICVADYGVLLSGSVLSFPKKLCLNVHGSILPKYRGASPVHAAILNQETETGVSIITMEKGLDTGPVWITESINLKGNEFYYDLLIKLGELGGTIFVDNLHNIDNSLIIPKEQDANMASYAGKISKEAGFFDLNLVDGKNLWAIYRAYYDWPNIYTKIVNTKFVITKLDFFDFETNVNIGSFEFDVFKKLENRKFKFIDKVLWFKIDNYLFKILKFKPESKSEMDPYSYLLGNPNFLDL